MRWRGFRRFFCGPCAFYNLAQVFAPAYDSLLLNVPLGIPLRLHADINLPSSRSTIGQTYQQIINDLDSAELFLPADGPNAYRNRPIRVAAQALLARVYLSMRNYPQARASADTALQAYSTLIDYNTLDTTAGQPIGLLNDETLYRGQFPGGCQYYTALSIGACRGAVSSEYADRYGSGAIV